MLNTIVQDYRIVAPIAPTDQPFTGSSAASKDILKFAFADNSVPRTVLDIGFGVGGLARMVKTDPALAHWQVDGIDGFDQTCRNVELFSKGWYRHVWHGLAQDIPLEALRQYDALCLFDVIEHLDPATAKALLRSLLEALGPASRLIISTPLWFYPQDQHRDGDLEEHLIGVPAASMAGLQPLLYAISPDFLIGNFVLGRESLAHIDHFQPTTDRGFSIAQGRAQVAALGLKADNSLQRWAPPAAAPLREMGQTPAHMTVNQDVLALIPPEARRIVEVGCMHGVLAAAHRQAQPEVHYTGIDIDADYAAAAAANCHRALAANIETMDDTAFTSLFPSDCWIFADCLEHLRDPWRVLARVRRQIDAGGSLLVCMPNAQHWSLQWRLASGQFRYEDSGLLDRTHLRWFTRITMLEMFASAGWRVEQGLSRNLNSPQQPQMLAAVRAFAVATGIDADQAVQDATAFQYVFRLRPA
jgi:SAM-dependent methyltransferase